MEKPIEFSKFYKLLTQVKKGNVDKQTELDWILAEYEHASDSNGVYDELGQIFCHIGLMELYEYTGVDNIKYISELDKAIWDYLEIRYGLSLLDHMVNKMKSHSEKHKLESRASEKWTMPLTEIRENTEGLARYVAEGIIEVIK